LPENKPPTAAEEKREDQFEKALADPDAPAPFHLGVYARTFLGGLLLFGLIFFYITHISGHGSLETYGQTSNPPEANHLTDH
ncbi:MAG TPA: hypothetical protein VN963_04600, partial [bacterium]|nr:hypothetical protein [bacterium]